MPKTSNICPNRMISAALCLFLCGVPLTGIAHAQTNQNGTAGALASTSAKDDIADTMDRLKQGKFLPGDIDLIARTKGVQAIPELKKQFELTQDSTAKISIASALVKLGDKDSIYWDYLVQGAADAITSDIPPPQPFDSKGRALPGPSPQYLAWAKVHNLTVEAADDTVALNFDRVLSLGESGDRTAIPLLRQALSSPNFMIEAFAARGLAQLQDKDSIPLIIQACQAAPADAAFAIARALLDFNDPQAQSAAKEFRPAHEAK